MPGHPRYRSAGTAPAAREAAERAVASSEASTLPQPPRTARGDRKGRPPRRVPAPERSQDLEDPTRRATRSRGRAGLHRVNSEREPKQAEGDIEAGPLEDLDHPVSRWTSTWAEHRRSRTYPRRPDPQVPTDQPGQTGPTQLRPGRLGNPVGHDDRRRANGTRVPWTCANSAPSLSRTTFNRSTAKGVPPISTQPSPSQRASPGPLLPRGPRSSRQNRSLFVAPRVENSISGRSPRLRMLIGARIERRSRAGVLRSGQQGLQLPFQHGRPDTLLLEADRGTKPVFDKVAVERRFGLGEIRKGSIGRAGSRATGFDASSVASSIRIDRTESNRDPEPIEDVESVRVDVAPVHDLLPDQPRERPQRGDKVRIPIRTPRRHRVREEMPGR